MSAHQKAKIQLLRIETNLIVGLSAIQFYKSPECHPILEETILHMGDCSIDCTQIVELIKNEDPQLFDQYIKMLLRAYIKESFEVVKTYCVENEIIGLKSEKWYNFARLIRNCLSHDFKLCFRKHDINKLPITWNNITMTPDMNNSVLKFSFFGIQEALDLVHEMHDFVENTSRD